VTEAGSNQRTPFASLATPLVMMLPIWPTIKMEKENSGNFKALVQFLLMTLTGTMLTVPASMWVSSNFSSIQTEWLFCPVSFSLSYLAGNPKAFAAWVSTRFTTWFDNFLQSRTPK